MNDMNGMNKALSAQKIGHANSRPTLTEDTRGAVAVLVAIMLVVLLSFGALALDISNAMIARNELQNVADASALAGARALGVIYQGLPAGTPYNTYVLSSPGAVVTAATGVALLNKARQAAAVVILPADIVIGVWNVGPHTLTPGNVGATGVRVTARLDGSAGGNGSVTTWLAGVMNISSMNVSATATAALTGAGVLVPADVPPPFSISQLFFTSAYCGQTITFSPTTTSCASWNTYDQDPPTANKVRNILQGLTPPNTPNPPIPTITAGQTPLEHIGGELGAAAWPDLVTLYTAKRVPDGSSPSGFCWNVKIPVYEESGATCSNPGGSLLIVGFASACVWDVVNAPPTRDIRAVVTCGQVTNGGGGGGSFGLLGSIPGLVE